MNNVFKARYCGLALVIALGAFGFTSSAAGDIETPQTMKAYNISLEDREYLQEGYVDKAAWEDAFTATVQEAETLNTELTELAEYLSEEKVAKVNNFSVETFNYIRDVQSYIDEMVVVRDTAIQERQKQQEALAAKRKQVETAQRTTNSQVNTSYSGDFQSQGVIYQNGIRYTYYSSNVLYHYRTPEWTAGSDGIYRDSDGNVVVASGEYPQGSIVSTPFGQGKVYDYCGTANTVDIYVKF